MKTGAILAYLKTYPEWISWCDKAFEKKDEKSRYCFGGGPAGNIECWTAPHSALLRLFEKSLCAQCFAKCYTFIMNSYLNA